MQTSRRVNLIGACLGLMTFGWGFYNPIPERATYSCPETQTLGGQLCRGQMPHQMSEEAWGQMGAVAYKAAAQLMQSNNSASQPLTEKQKKYLRPFFGDLVDRVKVVYEATLMEDWVAASFKINVGESNAQVYGDIIYVKKPHKEGDLEQLILLAHELVHCQQYEELGSLGAFGYHYFKEYKKAGESYRDNSFEVEAFGREEAFSQWLAGEVSRTTGRYHRH
jgi:hypothetical protein